ncbi:MAG: carbonic anhydrase [Acidobacteriota bacterium]
MFPREQELFAHLAHNHEPQAMMITCADARIDPGHLLQAKPGDLFMLRNAGNMVPAYTMALGAEAATIEYAMSVLKLKHIIVCGHTDCGAMRAVLQPELAEQLPAVRNWLHHAGCARKIVVDRHGHEEEQVKLRRLVEENVMAQLVNLHTHPSVASRLLAGAVHLYGWVYEIGTGKVYAFDAERNEFRPLQTNVPAQMLPTMRPAVSPAFAD